MIDLGLGQLVGSFTTGVLNRLRRRNRTPVTPLHLPAPDSLPKLGPRNAWDAQDNQDNDSDVTPISTVASTAHDRTPESSAGWLPIVAVPSQPSREHDFDQLDDDYDMDDDDTQLNSHEVGGSPKRRALDTDCINQRDRAKGSMASVSSATGPSHAGDIPETTSQRSSAAASNNNSQTSSLTEGSWRGSQPSVGDFFFSYSESTLADGDACEQDADTLLLPGIPELPDPPTPSRFRSMGQQTEDLKAVDVACQTLIVRYKDTFKCTHCGKPPTLPDGPAPLTPLDGVWQLVPGSSDTNVVPALQRFWITGNRLISSDNQVHRLKHKHGETTFMGAPLELKGDVLHRVGRSGVHLAFERVAPWPRGLTRSTSVSSVCRSPSQTSYEQLDGMLSEEEMLPGGLAAPAPPPLVASFPSTMSARDRVFPGYLARLGQVFSVGSSTARPAPRSGGAAQSAACAASIDAEVQTEGTTKQRGRAQTDWGPLWSGNGCTYCTPNPCPVDGLWGMIVDDARVCNPSYHFLLISAGRCLDANGRPMLLQRKANVWRLNGRVLTGSTEGRALRLEASPGVIVNFSLLQHQVATAQKATSAGSGRRVGR